MRGEGALRVAGTGLVCALLTAGAPAQAAGQQSSAAPSAPAAASDRPPPIADIVVTAQRREEALQRTPVAITAFDTKALARSNLFNAEAIQQQTPGLSFGNQSFGAGPQLGIRGVSAVNVSVGGEQGVQFVRDGVVLGRPGNVTAAFYDLERVEVLRGPQGTLFGRNANGGVINIITARPVHELTGSIDALYGNFDHTRVTGTLNLPITDTLALRVSGLYENRGGYSKNLYNGKDAEDFRAGSGRARLLWSPTSDFEVLLTAELFKSRDHGGLFHHLSSLLDANGRPYIPANGPSGIPVDYEVPTRTDQVDYNVPEKNKTYTQTYSAIVTWHGPFDVKWITGYGRNHFSSLNDVDASPYNVDIISRTDRGTQFSQELQFLSNDTGSPFKWVTGLFFYKEDDSLVSPYQVRPGQNLLPTGDVHQKSYAAYAQLSYNITRDIKLTAGLRYTEDHKRANELTTIVLPPGFPFACDQIGIPGCIYVQQNFHNKWHALTPHFGIDYQVSPDILLYASVTRGYQAGGYNIGAGQPPYNPEYLWSYEAGIKSRFFRDRFQLNLTGFHYDYTDLITSHFRLANGAGFTVLDNAGAAKVDGAELEVVAVPIPHLRLSGSVAYLHARYTKYESVDSETCPVPDPAAPGCQPVNLAGNPLPRAPKWTANGIVSYDIPIGEAKITLMAEDYWLASRDQFSYFNFPLTSQGPFHRTNFRARYSRDRWSIEGYVENIQNKRHLNNTYGDSSVETYGLYDSPRTFGVRWIANLK